MELRTVMLIIFLLLAGAVGLISMNKMKPENFGPYTLYLIIIEVVATVTLLN